MQSLQLQPARYNCDHASKVGIDLWWKVVREKFHRAEKATATEAHETHGVVGDFHNEWDFHNDEKQNKVRQLEIEEKPG